MGDELVGRTLGRYRIESRIGAGGMGTVYRATDETLRRAVAIKVLADDVVHDPERRRRFLQEARLAAALTHACIATVHDVGETTDGGIWIAMELVPGRSLRQWLNDGALDVPLAIHVAKEITRALVRAHGQGIVHRDLKPDNVMLGDDRSVKVLDFGLAKPFPSGDEAAAVSLVTREGRVLGTPGYMSPEQASGGTIDGRTDLFAVGVVLYEMLTGVRPFRGTSAIDVIVSTARDVPARPSGLGTDLVDVVFRCLEKKPEARFADASALLAALEAIDLAASNGRAFVTPNAGPSAPADAARAATPANATTRKKKKAPRSVGVIVGVAVVSVSVLAGAALWSFVRPRGSSAQPTSPTAKDETSAPIVSNATDAGLVGARHALGFVPANVGDALATIDVSKLIDLDVTGTADPISVVCGSQPNQGCVESTITQSDGSTVWVYVARSWKVEPGAVLVSTDPRAAILVATQTIHVLGRLEASARDRVTTAGGFAPANPGPGAGGDTGGTPSKNDGASGVAGVTGTGPVPTDRRRSSSSRRCIASSVPTPSISCSNCSSSTGGSLNGSTATWSGSLGDGIGATGSGAEGCDAAGSGATGSGATGSGTTAATSSGSDRALGGTTGSVIGEVYVLTCSSSAAASASSSHVGSGAPAGAGVKVERWTPDGTYGPGSSCPGRSDGLSLMSSDSRRSPRFRRHDGPTTANPRAPSSARRAPPRRRPRRRWTARRRRRRRRAGS